MVNEPEIWDARCLLCGSLVGQIVAGAFVHDPGCRLPPRLSNGNLRCCRCGGSLLKEPGSERQTESLTLEPTRPSGRTKYGGR